MRRYELTDEQWAVIEPLIPQATTGRRLKFLRRVPVDPMTRSTLWGLRSYQDAPDATAWGGQNVFDVYTTYDGVALDGTKYRDW